jgi:uncharacterized protein YjbI with pentapeptide repeats
MSEGDFIRADFTNARLDGANLRGATLPRAILQGASLKDATFQNAYLYRLRVEGTDLSQVRDLAQDQLDITCGDDKTKLPPGLIKPTRWPCEY